MLEINSLKIAIGTKPIVNGVNLTIHAGEVHVVMGPNGSGKSTLTAALMGHPAYEVSGDIIFNGTTINKLPPEERARNGMLLAFQNPIAVPGVTISNFLRTAYRQMHPDAAFDALKFHAELKQRAKELNFGDTLLRRSINDGFSGGEKKKLEMLQLLVLKPKLAIFDEIDTGLDVDALRIVAGGINQLQSSGSAILIITHYQRILTYISPQFVHILVDGRFIKEGGPELVGQIEASGYEQFQRT
jgi:Fe-S cluster assembly ATP-binding protein